MFLMQCRVTAGTLKPRLTARVIFLPLPDHPARDMTRVSVVPRKVTGFGMSRIGGGDAEIKID